MTLQNCLLTIGTTNRLRERKALAYEVKEVEDEEEKEEEKEEGKTSRIPADE